MKYGLGCMGALVGCFVLVFRSLMPSLASVVGNALCDIRYYARFGTVELYSLLSLSYNGGVITLRTCCRSNSVHFRALERNDELFTIFCSCSFRLYCSFPVRFDSAAAKRCQLPIHFAWRKFPETWPSMILLAVGLLPSERLAPGADQFYFPRALLGHKLSPSCRATFRKVFLSLRTSADW
uniref:Putative secreted protein n=1 Tax=Anopheles triannulatus TaxID=58253 RepID=A0A2M4B1H1_9DIPT